MKISMQSAAAGYLNKINNNANGKQKTSVGEAGRNFDQLVISSDSKQKAEEQLKTAAKKEVMRSVYTPQDNTDKVAALKEQVAQGTYKVDPEALASKILFLGDE